MRPIMQSADGADCAMKSRCTSKIGRMLGFFSARVKVIVPAQHRRNSFPFDTPSPIWAGRVAGSRLAQCSDSCVHKILTWGISALAADTISGLWGYRICLCQSKKSDSRHDMPCKTKSQTTIDCCYQLRHRDAGTRLAPRHRCCYPANYPNRPHPSRRAGAPWASCL